MRIGMISQWYSPEPGAAAHPSSIAEALVRRGHEVRVLTGYPNYPTGRVFDEYQQQLRSREEIRGVQVCRVPLWPSHNDRAVSRALSLGSFALSATTQVGWLRRADAVLVYLTPATVGLAAWTLCRVWKVPYVLSVQDLWPESVLASGFIDHTGLEARAERGINRLLGILYRDASGVAGIAPGMTKTLVGRGVPPERAAVVYNWVDERIFRPTSPPRAEHTRELDVRRTWMMYAGGIGRLQGLDKAVSAIALLADRPHIALALVGDGVATDELKRQAEREGVADRVTFLGPRPMNQIPALMAESAAQLVSLQDRPLFRGTVPSKLQSAMAAGQPVLCAVAGDAAMLVESSGAGLVCAPGDSQALADTMRQMDDLGESGRRVLGARAASFYRDKLSEKVGVGALESLLFAAATEARR